jgi:hypothetical protein
VVRLELIAPLFRIIRLREEELNARYVRRAGIDIAALRAARYTVSGR